MFLLTGRIGHGPTDNVQSQYEWLRKQGLYFSDNFHILFWTAVQKVALFWEQKGGKQGEPDYASINILSGTLEITSVWRCTNIFFPSPLLIWEKQKKNHTHKNSNLISVTKMKVQHSMFYSNIMYFISFFFINVWN